MSAATLDTAIDRLRLITQARAAGASWAQIGAGMKMSGPEAKREVHRLERETRRAFLIAAQAGQGIAVPPARKPPAPSGPQTLTVLTDREIADAVAGLTPPSPYRAEVMRDEGNAGCYWPMDDADDG